MPRVLVLARFFPPIGGAGVHRTAGSVRHLPTFGWDPVLVTGPGRQRSRWDYLDAALLDRVPAGAEVHRVPGTEPPDAPGHRRLDRLRRAEPAWVAWWVEEAVRLGVQAGAGADLVLASCAPYETARAGARVAAELGVPWVADLEDPWALDEMHLAPTAAHLALDVHRMRSALASASAIVMAAPEAARRMRSTLPDAPRRTIGAIPIGYEPDDFVEPAARRSDGVFRIVHTGSMHTGDGMDLRRSRRRRRVLGGAFPGVDFLTRSHVFLVQAIERLLVAEPSLRGRIELVLAGDLTAADRAAADGCPFVRLEGLLPHRESVALMRSADLLFLPMQDLPLGVRAGLIPYKTFEYLAARRPILAAVPDGDVRDLLEPLPHASVVRPADVAGMVAALRRHIGTAREPDVPAAELEDLGLQRARSVEQIARVLDAVVQAPRSRLPVAA